MDFDAFPNPLGPSGLPLKDRLYLLEMDTLMVCADCFRIHGPWRYREGCPPLLGGQAGVTYHQACYPDCPSLPQRSLRGSPPQPTWPGFDFNELLALCYCCGQEVIVSGTRGSLWFCPDCLARVRSFNETPGHPAIPESRDARMAGVTVLGRGVPGEGGFPDFARNMELFARSLKRVDAWRKLLMAESFILLGFKSDAPLEAWLARIGRLDKAEPFHRMSVGFSRPF